MELEEIGLLASSYLNNPSLINIYKSWVLLYILGDRTKSDYIFDNYIEFIKITATTLEYRMPLDCEVLYRGVLLPQNEEIDKHDLWKYNHVSFTENKAVAEAFASKDSIYGKIFVSICPEVQDYIGYIIKVKPSPEYRTWFSYKWINSHVFDDKFKEFIKYWNQKEIILGKR